VVNQAASTTSLASSLNPATLGASVTLTATISPAGPPTPTGTVTFTSGGTTIPGCAAIALTSSGTSACATTSLPVGTNSIKGAYSGDANYLTSTSAALSQVVNQATSTTAVASSLNPATLGASVTLTATIIPAGPPTPTGTVTLTSSGTTIPGCVAIALASSGTAACATTSLPVGTSSITAAYSGDANYLTSTSAALSQIVNQAASATAVVSSLNPSTAGQPVTLTATINPVGPPTPTGTVVFLSNGTAISGCSAIAVSSSRTAACATTQLVGGTDAITTVYSGDANYLASTSVTLLQVVNQAASSTTIASSLNPSTAGQSVTLTATINPVGAPTPTGTVVFLSKGTFISGCSAVAVSPSRYAACATTSLDGGTDSITATYSGDSNYLTSTSAALSQVVNHEVSTT